MHDGHRKRLRERYIASGLDGFAEHEVMELLLTYAIPRKNVNEEAHELMAKFGTVADVLQADPAVLVKTKGIGPESATFLSLIGKIMKRKKLQPQVKKVLNTPNKIAEYACALMEDYNTEMVCCLLLDAKYQLIRTCQMNKGDASNATVVPREVVEKCLLYGAASVVLLHNHPSGSLVPSSNDLITTATMNDLLCSIGVQLVDHYIVSGDSVRAISADRTYCIAGSHLAAVSDSSEVGDSAKLAEIIVNLKDPKIISIVLDAIAINLSRQ